MNGKVVSNVLLCKKKKQKRLHDCQMFLVMEGWHSTSSLDNRAGNDAMNLCKGMEHKIQHFWDTAKANRLFSSTLPSHSCPILRAKGP